VIVDDGKVLKAVNIPNADSAKAIVISENTVLPHGAAVKQLKLAPGYGKIVVVGKDEVRLTTLNHCSTVTGCRCVVDGVVEIGEYVVIFAASASSCKTLIALGTPNKTRVSV
jgi:hypothetical protein